MACICATITGMTADYPDAPPRLAPFLALWDYMRDQLLVNKELLEHAAEIWYVRDLYAVSR